MSRDVAHAEPLKLGNDSASHGRIIPAVLRTGTVERIARRFDMSRLIKAKQLPIVRVAGGRRTADLKGPHQEIAASTPAEGVRLDDAFARIVVNAKTVTV